MIKLSQPDKVILIRFFHSHFKHFACFAKGIQNKDTGPYALQNDHSSAII